MDRTEKLLLWNENKFKLDLAEKVDLLQSQAAYKTRALNYQLALEDELTACRNFNAMLGVQSETVVEEIDPVSKETPVYENISRLEKKGDRADVLSARALLASAAYAQEETDYRALPELSFQGSYSLNGLDVVFNNAWDQVMNTDKPTYTLGLSFIVPLDYSTLNKVKKGYSLGFYSAKNTLTQAELSAANDWQQLNRNWTSVKTRLSIARDVQNIQEERLKEEAERFKRGKTTTFLLITAENDLDDIILNVYQLVYEELTTAARAELYNTQPFKN
jgi:outer membrane protein TolC